MANIYTTGSIYTYTGSNNIMSRDMEKELFISKSYLYFKYGGMPSKTKYQKHAFLPTNVHM